MADVKNIATPQSIRVTCAEISESAARFKNELDTWMESSRKALEVRRILLMFMGETH